MKDMIDQAKLRFYQKLLDRPYAELREIVEIFLGLTPDVNQDIFLRFEESNENNLGSQDFENMTFLYGVSAIFSSLKSYLGDYDDGAFLRILKRLMFSIEQKEISAPSFKIYPIQPNIITESYPYLLHHTFVIRPEDAIKAAVTHGVVLPKELQRVYGINQITSQDEKITKRIRNELKRDAVSFAFWWKYPEATLEEQVRRIFSRLRKEPYFESFLHSEAGDRKRRSLRKIRDGRLGEKGVVQIPGTLEVSQGTVKFNFQRLRIFLETVAKLVEKAYSSSEEFLKDPLIEYCLSLGTTKEREIMEFILAKTLKRIDIPPDRYLS